MAYEGKCNANAQGTGTQNVCVEWGYVERFWRTIPDFSITTEALAQTVTTYQTAIQDEKLFPFPAIIEQQVNDEDAVNEELPLGITPIRPGKMNRMFMIPSNPYINKQLQSHDGLASELYFVDNNGGIRGVQGANDEFLPIPVQLFQVQKPDENTGADTGYKTKVMVVISDVDAYNNKAAIIQSEDLDFDAKELNGLEPVKISVAGTPTATTLTINATINGTNVPVIGLDDTPNADILVLAPDGVTPVAPNTITDNGDGTYDLAFTALATGSTVNLKDPSDMATEGYKSVGAATITFP